MSQYRCARDVLPDIVISESDNWAMLGDIFLLNWRLQRLNLGQDLLHTKYTLFH